MSSEPLLRRIPSEISSMFSDIAPGYDRMNLLMSAGMDHLWRRRVVRYCNLEKDSRVLDLGTGTAELAIQLAASPEVEHIVGTDISMAMMEQGIRKQESKGVHFSQADALDLPFPDCCFDAVVSSFVMRNLPDPEFALQEQIRILKPGGKVVFLDIVSPRFSRLPRMYGFFFFRFVPLIGRLLTNSDFAYTYLPTSTLRYPPPFAMLQIMRTQGLAKASFTSHCLGTVSIHVGTKNLLSAI